MGVDVAGWVLIVAGVLAVGEVALASEMVVMGAGWVLLIAGVLAVVEVALISGLVVIGTELGLVMVVISVATPKENLLDEVLQQAVLLSFSATEQQNWPSPHDDT